MRTVTKGTAQKWTFKRRQLMDLEHFVMKW